jgi:hypothetical protein
MKERKNNLRINNLIKVVSKRNNVLTIVSFLILGLALYLVDTI